MMAGNSMVVCGLLFISLFCKLTIVSGSVVCTNDCGYTTQWTDWSCDKCSRFRPMASRVRGLCCKAESKDQCLRRCHKTDVDINQQSPCHLVCKCNSVSCTARVTTAEVMVTTLVARESTFSSTTFSKLATTDNPVVHAAATSSYPVVTDISPLSDRAPTDSPVSSDTSVVQAETTFSSSTIGEPATTDKQLVYAAATSLSSSNVVTGLSTQSESITTDVSVSSDAPVVVRTATTSRNNVFSDSTISFNATVSGTNITSIPPVGSAVGLTGSTTLGSFTRVSLTGGSTPRHSVSTSNEMLNGPCRWLCRQLLGKTECSNECSKPRIWNFCTILSISLFFIGVLIGAIMTTIIVRCCCKDKKRHGGKRTTHMNNKEFSERQRNGSVMTYNDEPDMSPSAEKRGLRKHLEQYKTRRQISPLSSTTNLVDAAWSQVSDDSPVSHKKNRGSMIWEDRNGSNSVDYNRKAEYRSSMADDETNEAPVRQMQPFYIGGKPLTKGGNPRVTTEDNSMNTEKQSIQPRGNIWLTD